MSRTTYLTAGPGRSSLEWAERACPFCNTRDVGQGIKAPKGWYRCPACGTATPEHQMFYRSRSILVGPSSAFPTVELMASLTSDALTPAILSTDPITAAPGDQLIAQVLGRSAATVDSTVSVTWGSSVAAMLPPSETYALESGTSYGRCMRHTVVAHQSAAMSFDFSGTVPEHRVIVVVRVRGVVAPAIESFSDVDDRVGYPDTIALSFGNTLDFLVLCHGQAADLGTAPVTWDNSVTPRFRIGSASLVNSILSRVGPTSVPQAVQQTSGPSASHGTGFFAFRIQQ